MTPSPDRMLKELQNLRCKLDRAKSQRDLYLGIALAGWALSAAILFTATIS